MHTESIEARRVKACRAELLLDQPFFGTLALKLRLVEDPTCQTFWTDGRSLGFNPVFSATLTKDEVKAVLSHEVMHCACGHPWRRGARDHKRFNVAADYAINVILQDAGLRLPSCALLDAQYRGRNAEWIYDRLEQPQQQPEPEPEPGDSGKGDSEPNDSAPDSGEPGDDDSAQDGPTDPQDGAGQATDPGGMGEVRDAPSPATEPGDADGDPKPTEADWTQARDMAERVAIGQGKMPGGLRRTIAGAAHQTTDWTSVLLRYAQEQCTADYSWSYPNRRYTGHGIYLPGLRSKRCGRIAVGVDTSGSIDEVLLAQFGAAIQAIVDAVEPTAVDVFYCDAAVNHTVTFEPGDPIVLEPHGGGGTDFRPVFEAIEQGDTPTVAVYLTDLYGTFPDVEPGYPVIWAVAGNAQHTPPFGERVDIE
jgi:predicted metal-dependent peptidase